MVTIEQRRHNRLKPTQPVKVRIKAAGLPGLLSPGRDAELTDISEAGIGLRLQKGSFRLGQRISVTITLASVLPATVGTVVWATSMMEGMKLGIHFEHGHDDVKRFIRLNRHAFQEG